MSIFVMSLIANIAMANANFIKVKTAGEILSHIEDLQKDTVIFIDIDDTVITPASKTFRKPPYNKLIDDIKKHKDQYKNYAEILSNWRLQRKVMLVDKNWPDELAKMKNRFKVYGLTKMDSGSLGNIPSMERWRYNELRSLHIEFSESNIADSYEAGASFYKGIFMTGHNSKSATISYYLPYLKEMKMLVMIDDRQEHLEDIEKFCTEHSIKFLGILFDGMANLDGEAGSAVAEFQKRYLIEHAEWLEDEEAKSRMK